MALRGDPRTLRDFAKQLAALPAKVAPRVAARAAVALTARAQAAYSSGRTVYGGARPRGVGGRQLDLVETGATKPQVRFVAAGASLKCVLRTPYARFLIGKYKILPNGKLPPAWSAEIGTIVRSELDREVAG